MQDQPAEPQSLPTPAPKPTRARRKTVVAGATPARKVASFKLSRSQALPQPVQSPAPAEPLPEAALPPSAERADKPKKPKLVRDSFTIPKNEYAALAQLKERAAAMDRPAKKSELLRAGLIALADLSDAALRKALAKVPSIKTGRPRNAER